jgi:tetratricopeptide (TPR) repeat protein
MSIYSQFKEIDSLYWESISLTKLGKFNDSLDSLNKINSINQRTYSLKLITTQMVELYRLLLNLPNNFKEITTECLNNIPKKELDKVYFNIALSKPFSKESIDIINDCIYNAKTVKRIASYLCELGFFKKDIELLNKAIEVAPDTYILGCAIGYKGIVLNDHSLVASAVRIFEDNKDHVGTELLLAQARNVYSGVM